MEGGQRYDRKRGTPAISFKNRLIPLLERIIYQLQQPIAKSGSKLREGPGYAYQMLLVKIMPVSHS